MTSILVIFILGDSLMGGEGSWRQGTGVGEKAQANGGRRSIEFGLIGQQISEQAHWEQEPPKYLRVGSKLV